MISEEILNKLVPEFEPEGHIPRDSRIDEMGREKPTRKIALWAAHLRHQIHVAIQEQNNIIELIDNSGFIATGIFRTPSIQNIQPDPYFPIIDGYQFGAVILHANMFAEGEDPYISTIPLNGGNYLVPVVQFSFNIHPHGYYDQGHVAALFNDVHNNICGVTAAHVVSSYRIGQKVPVSCSDCGASATLAHKAPGLIDAAIVKFSCGGAAYKYTPASINFQSPSEGETVNLYFGESGTQSSTVMLALQTPSEIKSAAIPKHFLIDIHGHPGDSGSLVALADDLRQNQELVGMYLGESDCEDGNQNKITYGYAIDLKQVSDIFRILLLTGEFND